MNQNEIFGAAKWIDCPDDTVAPLFHKKFHAESGEKAELIICGLGYFIFKINGKKISQDLLVPSASNYSYRDMSLWSYPLYDEMSFRTYVMRYDITGYIADGENTLDVMLGTGYYHQNMYVGEGNVDYGTPKLCFLIKKNSGDEYSDSSTLCHKGYFRRCNLYYGEFQDYSSVPYLQDFYLSREIENPDTDYYYNIAPADKVTDIITSFFFIGERDGFKYYDAGINTVGRAVLKCTEKNAHIIVAYAEEIGGDYWNGMHFNNEGRYIDEFITDGSATEYHSEFSWQGFRYLKVSDAAELIRVEVIHSDCKVTSSFNCDNEVLNWLYNTYVHTQLCNMHSGVPSDCPHRERLGYTGDGQLCCDGAMMMLDSKEFYRKWLYDIADCQCRKSGHVQHTAPAMGGGGGPCGWGGAIVEVPYRYYRNFGDKNILNEFFPLMLKFLDYIESRTDNNLVCREEPGGWCLGDWLPPEPIRIPETFVNSCLYIGYMKLVVRIAEILSRSDEIGHLKSRIEKVTSAVNSAYYSFQQSAYCGDIDGASSIALSVCIGDDNVKNKLISKYRESCKFDTGIIATERLIGYLFSIHEAELAYSLLSNRSDISFYHMMKHGATTLWENWDGQSSRNHPMFGAVTKYLFTDILGIKQAEDSCGYEKVIISPAFIRDIKKASGHITTCKGVISVDYCISDNIADVNIKCPDGIRAEFSYGDYSGIINGSESFRVEVNA